MIILSRHFNLLIEIHIIVKLFELKIYIKFTVSLIQVDSEALQHQVAERRAKEEQERCRDLQFDKERLRHTQLAAQFEEKIEEVNSNLYFIIIIHSHLSHHNYTFYFNLQARRQINQDVNNYRTAYQRPETRREFDLYDPSRLKKDLPCRVADDDPRCGPSSAQKSVHHALFYLIHFMNVSSENLCFSQVMEILKIYI